MAHVYLSRVNVLKSASASASASAFASTRASLLTRTSISRQPINSSSSSSSIGFPIITPSYSIAKRYATTHTHSHSHSHSHPTHHQTKHAGRERVTVIGSGNWGSVAARIIAQNVLKNPSQYEPEVRMWVYEESIPLKFEELQRAMGSESVTEAGLVRAFEKIAGYHLTSAEAKQIVAKYGEKHYINLDQVWKWWTSSPSHANNRKLSSIINTRHENVKYLPGINLGSNLVAETDLKKAVNRATTLVFVTPHQFIKNICEQVKPVIDPHAKAISLIKGMEVTPSGFELISELIRHQLGIDCSVLMGANIASEIALEKFSEATVGYADAANGHMFQQLFHTDYFHVRAVPDVAGTEMCGTLKNIIALGAGFVDGLKLGNNTKAAIIRIGLVEMIRLSKAIFPTVQDGTFLESCGVADLITTCYGGRNRKVAEAFVAAGGKKSFTQLEAELLNGQKLQGVLTSYEVQAILKQKGWESQYPLISTIHQICDQKLQPSDIVRYAEIYPQK